MISYQWLRTFECFNSPIMTNMTTSSKLKIADQRRSSLLTMQSVAHTWCEKANFDLQKPNCVLNFIVKTFYNFRQPKTLFTKYKQVMLRRDSFKKAIKLCCHKKLQENTWELPLPSKQLWKLRIAYLYPAIRMGRGYNHSISLPLNSLPLYFRFTCVKSDTGGVPQGNASGPLLCSNYAATVFIYRMHQASRVCLSQQHNTSVFGSVCQSFVTLGHHTHRLHAA